MDFKETLLMPKTGFEMPREFTDEGTEVSATLEK